MMTQKKSISQDSQKKISTSLKERKTASPNKGLTKPKPSKAVSPKKGLTKPKPSKAANPKAEKGNPSIAWVKKRTEGKRMSSVGMEDGLAEDPQATIAARAHELFEQRGRVHGYDWEDWLRAEHDILGENPRF